MIVKVVFALGVACMFVGAFGSITYGQIITSDSDYTTTNAWVQYGFTLQDSAFVFVAGVVAVCISLMVYLNRNKPEIKNSTVFFDESETLAEKRP